jgi:hypothetical protein
MLTPWSDDVRPRPQNPIFADIRPRGEGNAIRFHATMDATPGWDGWFRRWERSWDSPAPDTLVITDAWEVTRGKGVVFHWTTRLPVRVEDGCIVIEGRRATAELRFPGGLEPRIEMLDLQDPRRTAVEQERRDLIQFGWAHARTQPVITVRQPGSSGTLRIEVKLRLKES